MAGGAVQERAITVTSERARLEGMLSRPAGARGAVVFAHGSDSSRRSPGNSVVAGVLQQAGFATLLMDLLEEREAADRRSVFNIDLLADRLVSATEWLLEYSETRGLPVGYFGASTGAAAALQAAAWAGSTGGAGPGPRGVVGAVVSRGGRPDMVYPHLPQVRAPALLIVGGNDRAVLEMNEAALDLLSCPRSLVVVPHAGHLFEEPAAMEAAARLARDWFERYLGQPDGPALWFRITMA